MHKKSLLWSLYGCMDEADVLVDGDFTEADKPLTPCSAANDQSSSIYKLHDYRHA